MAAAENRPQWVRKLKSGEEAKLTFVTGKESALETVRLKRVGKSGEAAMVRKKLESGIASGTIRMQSFGFGGAPAAGNRGDATGRVVSSEDVPATSGGDDEAPPSTLLH